MAQGTTKATVHGVFSDRLSFLQKDANNLSQAVIAQDQREWQVVAELAAGTKLTDVPNLHKPLFVRDPINQNYVQCVEGAGAAAGTVADVISLKNQLDFNAAEERAFRMRHATVCRSIIMQHGRRDGHSQSNLFPYIVKQAQDRIALGAVSNPNT